MPMGMPSALTTGTALIRFSSNTAATSRANCSGPPVMTFVVITSRACLGADCSAWSFCIAFMASILFEVSGWWFCAIFLLAASEFAAHLTFRRAASASAYPRM